MVSRRNFKDSLREMDKPTRMAFLFLEEQINDKTRPIAPLQPKPQTPNLSSMELKLDSLQKQVDGLKAFKAEVRELRTIIEQEERGTLRLSKDMKRLIGSFSEVLEHLMDKYEWVTDDFLQKRAGFYREFSDFVGDGIDLRK